MKSLFYFLEKKQSNSILCIIGPTGCGKTQLSLDIANQYNGEIINADSKQLYKDIPLTSGAITKEEMNNIPHHLFSFVSSKKIMSVAEHRELAEHKITEIYSRKKLPILVGGTALFILSLIENYQFPNAYDPELRKKLEEKTDSELWEQLQALDSIESEKIPKSNKRRIIRALEIILLSGEKKSAVTTGLPKYNFLLLHPNIQSREILYEKINTRMEYLWNHGIKSESKSLSVQNIDQKHPAALAIGIPEAFALLSNTITEEQAIIKTQQKARNYAKRQLTWWRKRDDIVYCDADSFSIEKIKDSKSL